MLSVQWKMQRPQSICLLIAAAVFYCHPVVLALSAASSVPPSSSKSSPFHDNNNADASRRVIPITVVSGFLGSGKTTLLQHLLENKKGLKIAVVVNDMASINVDAKLLLSSENKQSPSTTQPDGLVQFANGCACCGKSQELLTSLSELLTISDLRGNHNPNDQFDHIVVELSGIADPRAVRSNWQESKYEQELFLTERLRLDTLVTVVDCSTVMDYLVGTQSGHTANLEEAPQLFYRSAQEQREAEELREGMLKTDDLIPDSLWNTLQGIDTLTEESTTSIASLLASQIETADVVLLNKCDILHNHEGENSDSGGGSTPNKKQPKQASLSRIRCLVSALTGGRATLYETEFGRVEKLEDILACAQGEGVVLAGLVDDHQDAVHYHTVATKDEGHSHGHSHADGGGESGMDSLDHHEHHSHNHDHASSSCDDPNCNDRSHSHNHDHSSSSCDGPNCTDPSHSHTHEHNNHHAGIQSFVYNARRPFHPTRLASFVSTYLSVTRGVPPSTDGTVDNSSHSASSLSSSPSLILRSKGFCWLANTNKAATYWSHAGKSFELSVFGSWWATLPRDLWPPDLVETILLDFDYRDHKEDISQSDNRSVGDRRQSLVLIGVGLQNEDVQSSIVEALNCCLLTDSEWEHFVEHWHNDRHLASQFPSPFDAKAVEL